MIAATLPRLERRLNDVTYMLQNPSRASGHMPGDERDQWIRLAEEREAIINCIAICKTALEGITQQHLPAHQHLRGSSTGPTRAKEGITKVLTNLENELEEVELRQKRQEETREILDAQVQLLSATQIR